ncbi:uncharacterized protein LOC107823092 [Nicotiana tabacum]|uniref:uncharacterized protein LOC107823092 n=1 Tax=Nicotiana tabacum TaxID=4097 RepID=UPI003F4E682F
MATSTKKSNQNLSISLPSRSHPNTQGIEEELNKLQTWERSGALTTESICNGLSGFEELHNCMDHCLNLPLTLQVLSQHQKEKWFYELLDSSVGILDIYNKLMANYCHLIEIEHQEKISIHFIRPIGFDVHCSSGNLVSSHKEKKKKQRAMATFPFSKTKPFRSISLPVRSHPTTQRVEEVLNKLNGFETSAAPTAETICNSLLGLEELQKCMDDLLNSPQTLQILSQHQQGEWFEELLEKSVRILDICGATREIVSQYKENVRALQSSLRRRKGDPSAEAGITRFTTFSKKMKKDAKRLVLALKQVDCETLSLTSALLDADQETIAVIRALREANAICILVIQYILSFLSVPLLKPKQPKWSLVSKLTNNGRREQEGLENSTNLETRFETVEAQLDSIEKGLEGTFRSLIRSRSLLLNVFSC